MKAILLLFVLFPHKALEEQLGQKYSNWVQKMTFRVWFVQNNNLKSEMELTQGAVGPFLPKMCLFLTQLFQSEGMKGSREMLYKQLV